MSWHLAVTEAVKAIASGVVGKVVGIGKQAADDVVDTLEYAATDVRTQLFSDDALHNLTFDYIANLHADELQYLARRVAAIRRNVLRVEAYVGTAARMQYRYKIKTELTDDAVEQVEALIESLKQ